MWSIARPYITGRSLERFNKAATVSTKAQRLVDLPWKVVQWHKVKPFKPNPLLFKAAFFFFFPRSNLHFKVPDLKQKQIFCHWRWPQKGGFALLCDTREMDFFLMYEGYVFGLFCSFAKLHLFSLWQCKHPCSAQTVLQSIFPGSKKSIHFTAGSHKRVALPCYYQILIKWAAMSNPAECFKCVCKCRV